MRPVTFAAPKGDRALIQILMLHREFSAEQVQVALAETLRQRAIDVQAGRRLLLMRTEPAPIRAVADAENLSQIRVRQPELALYDQLLKGGTVH